MKRILVPVDFSDASFHAALYACQVADKMGGTIFLLYVLELGHERIYHPFALHEKYNSVVYDQRKEELQRFTEKLKQQGRQVQIKSLCLSGPVEEIILKFAKEENIELIICGNSGAGKAMRLVFGSVAEKLIKNGEIPVIAVPREAKIEIPGAIVFATSHFEKDKRVLWPVVQLAKTFFSKIHVVFYLDLNSDNVPDHIDHAIKLEHYIHFLSSSYPDLVFEHKIIEGDVFVEAVEKFRVMYGAGLIALVPYAKTFFEKMRSASGQIAFRSSCPVLIIPPFAHIQENQSFSSHSNVIL